MIPIDQAIQLVERHTPRCPRSDVPLAEALGRVLAEDIESTWDSPPHDKALVDGFAVVASDFGHGPVDLRVVEQVTAGEVPEKKVSPGTATRIMTGAPLPAGADAVVMVEDTRPIEPADKNERVHIQTHDVQVGQHILNRGASMRRGQRVLPAGRRLGPAEIGLLAELGVATAPVHQRPTVAILATGNELVPAAAEPGNGHIRNSNGPMLAAQVTRAGGEPTDLGIARDEPAELQQLVRDGLQCDVLLMSGGVSAGLLDLVPRVLAESGVRQVFHKVCLKPGKPLWFGTFTRPAPSAAPALVFGLPGNPVSTLVCFELFVRRALRLMSGEPDASPPVHHARLSCEQTHRGERPTYHPARWPVDGDSTRVQPLAWQGSADLCTLTGADCLIVLPAGDYTLPAGERVELLPL